jgi:lipopolysaccharide transport system permease protein
LLQPLLSTAIFAVIFGRFARMPSDGYPYPVFVFTALIPWTFFAAAVTASANSLVASAHLVTKVYFPRLVVPLASILAGLLDLALAVALLIPLSWFYGISWNPRLLATPALVADLVLVAVAIGAPLAALTVSYRDFRHAVPFLVQVWMYVTPIVYPSSLFPERWRWVLRLNPMSGVVEGFRSAFLGRAFDTVGLAVSLLVTLCILLAGLAYFERVQRRFADVI